MRFLDRNWAEGLHDDFTTGLYLSVYMQHLADIGPELPHAARALAVQSRGMLLSEAELLATRLDEKEGAFSVVLKFSSRGLEHYLELEYLGVSRDTSELDAFDLAEQILTDEFDLGPDGTFEHRLLFAPEGEAVIRFKDMRFHARHEEEPAEKDAE